MMLFGEEAGRPVLDDVRDPADATRDDAAASAERLDDDTAQAFRPGREHEHRRVVERAGDLGRAQRLGPAGLHRQLCDELERHVPQRAAADDVERGVGDARCRDWCGARAMEIRVAQRGVDRNEFTPLAELERA